MWQKHFWNIIELERAFFEEISHESARIYHRLKKDLKRPRKKRRRLIAIEDKDKA